MSVPTPATVISLVTIVGLFVLIAMGKVTYAEGGPAILLLAGVHTGAVLSGPSTPPTNTPPAPTSAPQAPLQPPQTSKSATGVE